MSLSALTLSESCLTLRVFWNSRDLEAGQQRAVHSSLISTLKHSPRILYDGRPLRSLFLYFVFIILLLSNSTTSDTIFHQLKWAINFQ